MSLSISILLLPLKASSRAYYCITVGNSPKFIDLNFSAARVETYFYDKLDKWETTKRRDRETNCEALGQQMIDAGNSFGPGTAYGKK